MLYPLTVADTSELERFQRWLQSELANASLIDDKDDRGRRTLQIELAISNNSEVKPVTTSGVCHSCGAEKLSDLQFCPVCGEF